LSHSPRREAGEWRFSLTGRPQLSAAYFSSDWPPVSSLAVCPFVQRSPGLYSMQKHQWDVYSMSALRLDPDPYAAVPFRQARSQKPGVKRGQVFSDRQRSSAVHLLQVATWLHVKRVVDRGRLMYRNRGFRRPRRVVNHGEVFARGQLGGARCQ
jgi:hypothetical protein